MRGLVAVALATIFVAIVVAQVASRSIGVAAPQAAPAPSSSAEAAQPAPSTPQPSSADDGMALDRNSDGHFYADVRINGSFIHMLVDTGASSVALSRNDAHMAGVATSIGMNDVVGEGADGAVRGEYVKLDRVELGPLTAVDLDAVVLNDGRQSLLGQNFLSRFASVKIEGDRMVLR